MGGGLVFEGGTWPLLGRCAQSRLSVVSPGSPKAGPLFLISWSWVDFGRGAGTRGEGDYASCVVRISFFVLHFFLFKEWWLIFTSSNAQSETANFSLPFAVPTRPICIFFFTRLHSPGHVYKRHPPPPRVHQPPQTGAGVSPTTNGQPLPLPFPLVASRMHSSLLLPDN